MAEIEAHGPANDTNIENIDNFIDAFQKTDSVSKCWNCDVFGHHWQDCSESSPIFCNECGAKETYKTNCAKYAAKRQNMSKNLRQTDPQ